MFFAQSLAVIFALLAAWAWMKSAFLQVKRFRNHHTKNWLDDLLNRISTNPAMWNAIAAGLSAAAAISQGITFLLANPLRP